MRILIRSSSFLMQDSKSWDNLKKFNPSFSEYGEIINFSNHKKKFDFDITIIFLQDLISYYLVNKKDIAKERRKIDKILKLIEKKIKLNKNINHVYFLSRYCFLNYINNLKDIDYSEDFFQHLSDSLYALAKKNQNISIINLDKVFALQGFRNCFDARNFNLFRCRLSINGLNFLTTTIRNVIEGFIFPRKKVLLLDCDNTLWGGVLAEDGSKKIKLGEDGEGLAFTDFQRAIKKIKETGILLAILSKNNEKDVKKIFRHNAKMVLKEDDISSFKVNWVEKSKNIKDLSKDLSLNADSFIFWDDNPIEREKIRRNCKGVEVIEPDKEVSNWSKQLLELKSLSKYFLSKEDLTKTEQYKSRRLFQDSKNNSKDELFFLKNLNIKPSLKKINDSNISRAVQLSSKTNQFNFNCKRLTQSKLLNKTNNISYMINLVDDFGAHGYISLINCVKIEKCLFVDQFLMSCRILGRYVENWILDKIIMIAKKNNIQNIIFEFIKTKNNEVAKNFIKQNNFKKFNTNLLGKKMAKNIKKLQISKNSELFNLPLNSKIKYLDIYGSR